MLKKSFFCCLFSAIAAFSFAAGTFWCEVFTWGPDCYADGTPVLEGEHYGFVWTSGKKSVSDFCGFNSDGTLVDPGNFRAITFFEHALDDSSVYSSHCAFPSECANGTLYFVMFDTRTASGTLGGVTNGWGIVATANLYSAPATGSDEFSLSYLKTKTVPRYGTVGIGEITAASELPHSVSAAKIEKIDVTDTDVVLTVGGTSPYAYYVISASEELGASQKFSRQPKNTAVQGVADGSITIRYPKSSGGRFFKVVADSLMNL